MWIRLDIVGKGPLFWMQFETVPAGSRNCGLCIPSGETKFWEVEMANDKAAASGALLDSAQVQKVISDINPALKERIRFIPPKCTAFTKAYTTIKEDKRYRFHVHTEARKKLPAIIDNSVQAIIGLDDANETLKKAFSRRRNIGIVFSGGPAPGGHNVIAGIYDMAKRANPETKVYGFWLGPDGVIENKAVLLTDDLVDAHRNLGGFSMIKTGRTKIDTQTKMDLSKKTCRELELDALVIVGGDDSNTNAAFLAQELAEDGEQVIGVPKTIDGDIQVSDADGRVLCAMSFGFHTAARSFSTAISNLCTDSSSDVKYWHVCKVMGRVASHLALEVALQTHANVTLIGEDLANYVDHRRLAKVQNGKDTDYTAYGMTLRHLSRVISYAIDRRAAAGKNYGVIVIPEGILEFVNEIQNFIIKLNTIIADYSATHDLDFHTAMPLLEDKLDYLRRLARQASENGKVSVWNMRDDDLFSDIPAFFQEGLLTERDNHGNFQFSLVQTDKILMDLVEVYLEYRRERGSYKIGLGRADFVEIMVENDLDADYFGQLLFENYAEKMLLLKPSIISLKTLKQELVKAGALTDDDPVPAPLEKVYQKTVPKFKTQRHFYGYDGRGADPTRFDCTYTYNLGMAVFSLIANGATGQMAAIKNLEFDFEHWQPIGIPIASLMHLEERKGKLALVLEKGLVDINSTAFKVAAANREKWLAAVPGPDHYRHPGPIRLDDQAEDRPITLYLNGLGRKPE